MIRDFGSFTRRGLLADLDRPVEMRWGQIGERAGGARLERIILLFWSQYYFLISAFVPIHIFNVMIFHEKNIHSFMISMQISMFIRDDDIFPKNCLTGSTGCGVCRSSEGMATREA